MLKELQKRLQARKNLWKYTLIRRREWMERKKKSIMLGIYEDEKEKINRQIRVLTNEMEWHKQKVYKILKEINTYKKLTGGEIENNDDIIINDVIEKYTLNIENNFQEANKILDSGYITAGYNSKNYYSERVKNQFVGSYKVKVERKEDYEEFIKTLVSDAIAKDLDVDFSISFEEWKTGYKNEDKRKIRLNKFLKRKGFSQYILDYYSLQRKEEKEYFVTITDRVHHIAGMSYYSDGEWDGMGGSSCMDPTNNYEESIRLLGTLHDDKLLIIFLHKNLTDLEDMNGKALARTVGRIVHVDGEQFLIGTRLYGSQETKNALEKALRKLNKYNIFSHEQMKNAEDFYHWESANGGAIITYPDEVYVSETVDEWIHVECPLCYGSGKYIVRDSNYDEHNVTCPSCSGLGEIEWNICFDVNEYIEIEVENEILPYDELYTHRGSHIEILIDKNVLFSGGREKDDKKTAYQMV